jgi:SAM-dependent methyltransferase
VTDLDALKEGARRVWAAGDYPAISTTLAGAGAATARRAAAGPGLRLLDVAAGDGNVAIPAAQAGAAVTAVDLTPELLEAGRARAHAVGADDIEWVTGDAEALPVPDGAFDAVTSNFGAIFAPRHEVVAAELVRAVRPGGRVVLTAWDSDGVNGHLLDVLGPYLPAPPPGVGLPMQWGDEGHGRDLLTGAGLLVDVERDAVRPRYASVDEAVAFYARSFGPLALSRPRLEDEGRWDEALAALHGLYAATARTVEDGVELSAPYLRYVGRRAS